MPTGSLERVVNRLSALPQQFTALLKGDQGQPLGLDQLLEKIQSADFSTDQDIQNLKEILIRAKTTLDQQSQEVAAMKETNTQYKNLIDSFLPLLNQLGQEDATYKQTAERVSSLLGHSKITDLESGQFTQLKSDIQQARLLLIERGQKQAQLQKDLEKNMPNLTAKIEENKQLLEQIQQARSALTQQEIALKADSATA
jgi:chromosome segregation ATPase